MPMGGGSAAGGMGMSPYLVAFIWTVVVLAGLAVVIVVVRKAQMMFDSWRDRDRAPAPGSPSAPEGSRLQQIPSDAEGPGGGHDGVADSRDISANRSMRE